ncbi:MAG: acyl--CoA ligase [bacterium]|nr:acyl--CoA ligase [bacterium]
MGYLFDRAVAREPEKVALYQDDRTLTYGELDRRANRVADALRSLGVARGQRVALLFDNHIAYIESCFGVFRLGAVAVPVNPRLADDSVAHILGHSDAAVLICSPNQSARAARLVERAPQVGVLVCWVERLTGGRTARSAGGIQVIDYEPWIARAGEAPLDVPIADDAIAFQPYTSGSTGVPKGCLLTHGGQRWNVGAVVSARGYARSDRALVAAPLSHKNAMVSGIKPMLYVGGSVVLLAQFEPEAYVRAIERYRPTCTTGVPAIYNMIFARPELFERYDVSSIRFCCIGSAGVSPEIARNVDRFFNHAAISESYGSTEGGPVTLVQPRDHRAGLLPVAGTELAILRTDGSPCAAGETGELRVRNPGVIVSYYKDPAASESGLEGRWYRTRDLARRGDDGRYLIVGRADDMIITGGENVFPKEVEDVLRRHPSVADVAVVALEHAVKGEVPVAFVVAREPPAPQLEERLKRHVLEHAPAFAHPRRIWFLDELPLSSAGKIDRRTLHSMAADLAASSSTRV